MKKYWWGLAQYSEIETMQHNVFSEMLVGGDEIILAGEFKAVITLGKRADHKEVLKSNLPVVSCERGGLATLHSEGQLVIYPIIDLRKYNWGIKKYVQVLLETTQKTLNEFGVEAYIDLENNPGVYTPKGKIAFCGIKVSQGISTHGLSINIKNDISLFENLIPCGSKTQQMDLVQNHCKDVSPQSFFKKWAELFKMQIHQKNNTFTEVAY